MHDNQNPTPDGDSKTTPGRHRMRRDTVHVGCFFSNPIRPRDTAKHAADDEPQAVAS